MIQIGKQDILTSYMRQLNKIPAISDREFDYLYHLIQKKDRKAKQRLIEGNLKLVVKVVCKYRNLGVSMMDLIEEGNLGLIKAADKFEEEKGAKFSTYAIWWIKQKIRRALDNQAGVIRIPSYAIQNIRRCVKYWEELGTSEHFNENVKDIEKAAKDLDLSIKEVKNVLYSLEMSRGIASLDCPVSEDENITVCDMIQDVSCDDDPCDILQKEIDFDLLTEGLKILSDKEQKIIRQRFGLDGNRIKTLSDIGKEWGVSRERIRQIAESAIVKIRNYFHDSQD